MFSYRRFPVDKVVWEALSEAERRLLSRRWKVGLGLVFGGLAINTGVMVVALYLLDSGILISVWLVAAAVPGCGVLAMVGAWTLALTRMHWRSQVRQSHPAWFTPDGQLSEAGLQVVDPLGVQLGGPASASPWPAATLATRPSIAKLSSMARRALKNTPNPPPPAASLTPVARRGRLHALPLKLGWQTWKDGPTTTHFDFPRSSPQLVRQAFRAILGPLGFSLVFEFPRPSAVQPARFRATADRAFLFERGLLADPELTRRHDASHALGTAAAILSAGALFRSAVWIAGRGPLLLLLTLAAAGAAFVALTLGMSFADGKYWSDIVLVSYSVPTRKGAKGESASDQPLAVAVTVGRALTADWQSKSVAGRKVLSILPLSHLQAIDAAIRGGLVGGARPLPLPQSGQDVSEVNQPAPGSNRVGDGVAGPNSPIRIGRAVRNCSRGVVLEGRDSNGPSTPHRICDRAPVCSPCREG